MFAILFLVFRYRMPDRQLDAERGAAIRFAINLDVAAVFLNDAVRKG